MTDSASGSDMDVDILSCVAGCLVVILWTYLVGVTVSLYHLCGTEAGGPVSVFCDYLTSADVYFEPLSGNGNITCTQSGGVSSFVYSSL